MWPLLCVLGWAAPGLGRRAACPVPLGCVAPGLQPVRVLAVAEGAQGRCPAAHPLPPIAPPLPLPSPCSAGGAPPGYQPPPQPQPQLAQQQHWRAPVHQCGAPPAARPPPPPLPPAQQRHRHAPVHQPGAPPQPPAAAQQPLDAQLAAALAENARLRKEKGILKALNGQAEKVVLVLAQHLRSDSDRAPPGHRWDVCAWRICSGNLPILGNVVAALGCIGLLCNHVRQGPVLIF